jgi:hypothetical protein
VKKLVDLAWIFFWISTVTLGGGMAMLPLMDREFVEKRKYLTEQGVLRITMSLLVCTPSNLRRVFQFCVSIEPSTSTFKVCSVGHSKRTIIVSARFNSIEPSLIGRVVRANDVGA